MENSSVLLKGNGDFSKEQYLQVQRGDDEAHLLLSLGLTTAPGCNMRCIYCYNEGGRREAGRFVHRRMTLKDYEKAIREAAALGAQSVIMVGVGETMMDKHFRRIVEFTDRHGMIPLVFTNGTMLDKIGRASCRERVYRHV
jgi:MoaA/NifB/PqqE/SkfB family radical SAM enzyme